MSIFGEPKIRPKLFVVELDPPSVNGPIKHGDMENADIFQCLAPHCGAFLFQKW
jgi:hypothetical protein